MYSVKSIFYTLQGEGANSGRPAVFVRFAGCNLWSGRQTDRGPSCSAWCDTDFVGTDGNGGGRYDAVALVRRCASLWPNTNRVDRFAVLTGGEPTLQVDTLVVDVLHRWDFVVAIETNGTRPVPSNIDWITVSPKAGTTVVQRTGDELKVAWPQTDLDLDDMASWGFARRYLQPIDDVHHGANVAACVERCMADPRWRLSFQMHKAVGLP